MYLITLSHKSYKSSYDTTSCFKEMPGQFEQSMQYLVFKIDQIQSTRHSIGPLIDWRTWQDMCIPWKQTKEDDLGAR